MINLRSFSDALMQFETCSPIFLHHRRLPWFDSITWTGLYHYIIFISTSCLRGGGRRRRRWVILISSTGNGLVWLQTTDHRTENYNFIYLANVVSPVSGMGWGRVATNYNIPTLPSNSTIITLTTVRPSGEEGKGQWQSWGCIKTRFGQVRLNRVEIKLNFNLIPK